MPATKAASPSGLPHGARLLALLSALLAVSAPAFAQQSALRGAVDESETENLLRRPSLANRNSPLEKREPKKGEEEKAPAYVPAEEPDPTAGMFDEKTPDEDQEPATQPRRAAKTGEQDKVDRDKLESEAPKTAEAEAPPSPDEPAFAGRALAVDAQATPRNARAQAENIATGAIEGRGREPDTNPYSPLGLRLGTFLLNASLEQGLTWNSNATSSATPQSGITSETTLRLGLASDWAVHQALLNAYGTWRQPVAGAAFIDPEMGMDGSLRLDLDGDITLTGAASYALTREDASSPVPLAVTASRPLQHEINASLTAAKDLGKFRFSAKGAVNRLSFGDAALSGGGVLSQADRDATYLSATLRAGYQVSAAFTPFAEVEIGRRAYDLTTDSAGYQRSATRLGLRAGTMIDVSEKLNGEVSAGWVREDFDDTRLASISALTLNSTLNWSPLRGTTIAFAGSTGIEGTTTAGSSGSVLYSGSVTATRELRANLTANAAFGLAFRDYASTTDTDTTLSASAGFTWWLNRHAGLTGRMRHETVRSTQAARSTQANSVYLGVKFQR